MIWIYRLLFLPLFLISCPYYFGRMIKRGGYAKDFTHRFGCVPVLPPRREGVHRVWIQAVSVGETEAVAPLLRELKSRGNVEVILTREVRGFGRRLRVLPDGFSSVFCEGVAPLRPECRRAHGGRALA